MIGRAACAVSALALLAFATTQVLSVAGPAAAAPAPTSPAAEAARSLAPSGRLRVAINLGNAVLAQRDATTGEIKGVSATLAKALGERLNLPVDLIPFAGGGPVFDALDHQGWDLAFLAIEPARATKIDFSPPYVLIDGTYLVFSDSPYRKAADLDHAGARIAVAKGAAYDLYLSRTLKHADLQRADTSRDGIELFKARKLEAAAGLRQALIEAAKGRSDLRVLDDRFERIEQAIAVPRGREAGSAYVRAFIESMKASGAVRAALAASGQDEGLAAPPAG